MASNRYRNRAGALKPETWHLVTVTTESGPFERALLIRPLESFRAAKDRIARAYRVRAQNVAIGKRLPGPDRFGDQILGSFEAIEAALKAYLSA